MLGRGAPVGVDRLHLLGIGLALPADEEPLGQRPALVDLALGHDRQAEAAGRLRGVRQDHDRDPAQVGAGLLVGDVVGLPHAERGREHRDGGLDVGAYVAGVDRDVVGLGRRETGFELAVDEQAPDLLERDPPDDLLDVDTAVAEGGAFLVRLGDLGLERDDPFEPVMHLGHADSFVVVAPAGIVHHAPSAAVGPGSVHPATLGRRRAVRLPGAPGPDRLRELREEYTLGGLDEARRRPRPARDGAALARRRRGRGPARPDRDGALDRVRARAAVEPHGAAQGPRHRPGLLHQLRVPQGRGPRRPAGLRAAVPVVLPAAPGPRRGTGGAGRARRRARRTSRPGPRASQLGAWASPQSRVVADRAALDEQVRRGGGPVRRRRGAAAAVLGRLPGGARDRRAVAGEGQPDARPAALDRGSPTTGGWQVERLAP